MTHHWPCDRFLSSQTAHSNGSKSALDRIEPDVLWVNNQKVMRAVVVFEEEQVVFDFPPNTIANEKPEKCRVNVSDVEAFVHPLTINFEEVRLVEWNREHTSLGTMLPSLSM